MQNLIKQTLSRGSVLCRQQHNTKPPVSLYVTHIQLLWSSPTYGTGSGPVYMVTVCMPYTVMVTIPRFTQMGRPKIDFLTWELGPN